MIERNRPGNRHSMSALLAPCSVGRVLAGRNRPRTCNRNRRTLGRSLLPLLRPPQQLIDARLKFLRTIHVEAQVRHPAYPKPRQQLMPDISLGRHQRRHRLLFGFQAAIHRNINARRLVARIHLHFRYIAESNPRIGKLALQHRTDLFPQTFRHPVSMVHTRSWLCHTFLPGKPLSITEAKSAKGNPYNRLNLPTSGNTQE